MSRGRHTLPKAPRSGVPLAIIGLVLVLVAIAAVWWVDTSLPVRVAATAAIVLVALGAFTSVQASRRTTASLWQEAAERRRELIGVQRELGELRTQHVEMFLELRALRLELVAASEQTVRSVQVATDQQALMRDLLTPRQPVPDPVYPSMHVPLVRAAFAAEVPSKGPSTDPAAPPSVARPVLPTPGSPMPGSPMPGSEDSSGGEPFPPRELLDLTASEIAALRPAN